MARKKRLFGFIEDRFCDCCKKQIKRYEAWYSLCKNCENTPKDSFRNLDVVAHPSRELSPQSSCSLCQKSFAEALDYELCDLCTMKHPDYTHIAWLDPIVRLLDFDSSFSDCCICCHSVRLCKFEVQSQSLTFTYYRLGFENPTTTPFKCSHEDPQIVMEIAKSCVHRWITIATDYIPQDFPEEGEPPFLELSHFWCTKCGELRVLDADRYEQLPRVGCPLKYPTKSS